MAIAIISGLLSDPLVWDAGVMPVAPEVAEIAAGVVVTQDVPWDIGDGVALAITINAGGELITNAIVEYRGNITLDGTLTNDDGSDLVATAGDWTITQSDGSTWRRVGVGIKPIFRASAGNHWVWRDANATDGYTIELNGIEFFNCGTASIAGVHQRGNNAASLNIQLLNFLWHTCGQLRLGVGARHHANAICQVDTIVVVNPVSNQSAIEYAARFPVGWPANSRYLRNIYIVGTIPNGNPVRIATVRPNVVTNPAFEVSFAAAIDANFQDFGGGNVSVSGPIMFDQYTGGSSEIIRRINNGSWTEGELYLYSTRNNGHLYAISLVSPASTPPAISNHLIEMDGTGGANFLPHKDGGITQEYGLVIGGNAMYSTSANTVGTSMLSHVTHVILPSSLDGDASLLQETNEVSLPYALDGQSNLRVDLRATPTVDFAKAQPSIPGAIDQFRTLDFNCHHIPNAAQPFNPYPTIVITGATYGDVGFGGNDMFVDPQFQHAPRHTKLFDSQNGGDGTAINMWREFFKRSGYDVTGAPAVWNPAYDWQAAKAWIEEAYIPTNLALQGTAHDGGDIGAFPVLIASTDTTPPVITLTGPSSLTVEQGTTYTDQGAVAQDDVDGFITADIVTVNPVDTAVLGSYTVTYNVQDVAGNAAVEVTRTVNVLASGSDFTPPVITLIGSIAEEVSQGASYTDPGVSAQDNVDGDITANVVTTIYSVQGQEFVTEVSTTSFGIFIFSYNVTDAAGNQAQQRSRIVEVVPDTIPPVITGIGVGFIDVPQNVPYFDEGATALDDVDGDITSSIVTVNSVNVAVPGTYTVTYNVIDAAGNAADELVRTVTVVAVADTTPPVITLNGPSSLTVEQGATYIDEGATAQDDVDGDVTSSIITVNPVDTALLGNHTVTYNVQDAAGNVADEIARVVSVTSNAVTAESSQFISRAIGNISPNTIRDLI